jgi:hypothetical protein
MLLEASVVPEELEHPQGANRIALMRVAARLAERILSMSRLFRRIWILAQEIAHPLTRIFIDGAAFLVQTYKYQRPITRR